jgi:hypothetical protein
VEQPALFRGGDQRERGQRAEQETGRKRQLLSPILDISAINLRFAAINRLPCV